MTEYKQTIPKYLTILLLCLGLSSCALPPKFSTLITPPAGQSNIYIYSSVLDINNQIDQTIHYSINSVKSTHTSQPTQTISLKKHRLLAKTSHVYSVSPGKFAITNLAGTNSSTAELYVKAGETQFVYFQPKFEKNGSVIKFGHAIVLNINTPKNQQEAVALMRNTRLYPFDNTGTASPGDPSDAETALVIWHHPDSDSRTNTTNTADKKIDIGPTTLAVATVNVTDKAGSETANTIRQNQITIKKPVSSQIANEMDLEESDKITVATTAVREQAGKSIIMQNAASQANAVESKPKLNTAFSSIPIEDIYQHKVNCKKPFRLSQGCSIFSMAKISIYIEDKKIKVSASKAGDIIYLGAADTLSKTARQLFSLSLSTKQKKQTLKDSVLTVSQLLFDNNINVSKLHRVKDTKQVVAWILETDKNSLQLLLNHQQNTQH